MKRRLVIACLCICLLGCLASQPTLGPMVCAEPLPGFWRGFWHGFIAPGAFIASLVSTEVRMYAFPNIGRWYDLGFMLGIGGFSGGIMASRRRYRPRDA